MKIIENCYDKIGMFDSKVGEIFFSNDSLILPVSNIQIDSDFENNNFKKIAHIDYSYLVFIGVIKSYKKVYYVDNQYEQYSSFKNHSPELKTETFELELIEILNYNFQYLWTIEASKFRLVIPQYGSIREVYLDNSKLDLKHFFSIESDKLEIIIG
ncbi:hypothetical protein [Flavobacterium sp.]|uniref:hypothetical protein n=1 Tax=Flavobacterium sp. TaxID=239 RepID=UPI0031D96CAE